MLDPFDYKEPACVLCEGKEFYYPDPEKPKGTIPVRSVLDKLDAALAKNDMDEGVRLLTYWEEEGKALADKRGLVTIYSEQMGLFRKTGDRERGMRAVEKGLALVKELGLDGTVSGATIMLNGATTLKAFGKPEEGLPIYRAVEEIYDKNLPEYDVKKAGFYNNSALCYADVGDLKAAESNYQKALDVLSHNEKGENEIAITYVNMAHLAEAEGEEDRAYGYMEKALEVLRSPAIEQNGYHAFVCSKCAPSFGHFGYFLAEEELSEKVKRIYERA